MICCTCKKDKPLTEFGKNKSRPNGLQPNCHKCRRGQGKKWRKEATPEMLEKEYQRTRRWRIFKQFNLPADEYEALKVKQNGLCASCGQPETISSKLGRQHDLAVDHNHKTGQVRSLLCQRCNTILGRVEEDIEVLLKLVEYLRKHESLSLV